VARLDDAEQVQFETRAAWREWLAQNHATSSGVWAIYCKKSADRTGPDYEDLVREALCFGWIDSTARRVDDARTRLYFCPRKRGGGWAATNKARIAELTAEGRMTPAGQAVVDQAIADGSWNALDQSEALEVPTELARAFRTYPGSRAQWAAFPPGVRKQLIYWVTAAKRPETRAARADETARLAQQGIRANQWVPRDRR
jgi:uncharacterized protein YdeI (YjbR/CyaY-like superfamily)